jgi:hypothetical protein
MPSAALMTQSAPYPDELAALVDTCAYRPGWKVRLDDHNRGQGSIGLTLIIQTHGYNAYHPEHGQNYDVLHYMPVPPAAYDARSWRRWLLDQFLLVEEHEACEFFTLDNEHPFAPSHGPGNDPYLIRELGTEADQRTSFRGVLKEAA